jgi:obscurin-RhoGEF protein
MGVPGENTQGMEALLNEGASQRLMPMPSLCPVPEVTVLEPLQDVQLSEGQDAHFQCQLSRASGQEARWALGGVPLQANEMNDISVEQGTLHLLTLHKVSVWDLSPPGHERFQVLWERSSPPEDWVGQVISPCHWGLARRIFHSWLGWSYQGQASFSLSPQVTLEDAGTITFQVGSCSSEAQLKVTGKQSPPTLSPLPVDAYFPTLQHLTHQQRGQKS